MIIQILKKQVDGLSLYFLFFRHENQKNEWVST